MLDKFLLYIKAKKIFKESDRPLLAVSGGRDSMVMLHLFSRLQWPFGVAHINHNLRGAESDADALLVRQHCQEHQIPYYEHTIPEGLLQKRNLQAKARQLRYEWLEFTAKQHGYSCIATAHHQTDSVETLFIQMLRATGLAGMTGIPYRRGLLIRPMLGLTSMEIAHYAATENVSYREDKSNAEDKYLRNRIRHHVLPALEQAMPNFQQPLANTLQHLLEAKEAMDWLTESFIQRHRIPSPYLLSMPVKPFTTMPEGRFIFWYSLHPYGFNRSQTDEMLCPHHISGKQWRAHDCVARLDRGVLTIMQAPVIQSEPIPVEFVPPMQCTFLDTEIECTWTEVPAAFSEGPEKLYLDADTFTLPLHLRKWHNGDRMKPLGMGGKSQKVQDILTNAKLSSIQKQQSLILESAEGLLCIPGMRIAEWAKVGSQTKKVLCVTVRPASRR